MKEPHELVSEMIFCDPTTHIFNECRIILKKYAPKLLGIYAQRLDACNYKLRFAAQAYLNLKEIIEALEFGEFIYFDDENRLKATFYLETYLIFLRTSIDLTISAYSLYFSGKTNIDSINNFLKKRINLNGFQIIIKRFGIIFIKNILLINLLGCKHLSVKKVCL